MSAREFNPFRLDVAALAQAGASLAGEWPLAGLDRLLAAAVLEALSPQQQVRWSVHGELRPQRAGAPQVWLRLQAAASVALECQRCLQPVVSKLDIDRAIRFVPSEEEATELDADSEDDVLALTRTLDLKALVEDELLLALPIVPRHDACPAPLSELAAPDAQPEPPRGHPFAALAALKRGPAGGDKR